MLALSHFIIEVIRGTSTFDRLRAASELRFVAYRKLLTILNPSGICSLYYSAEAALDDLRKAYSLFPVPTQPTFELFLALDVKIVPIYNETSELPF